MSKARKDPSKWIPRQVFAAYCGTDDQRMLNYYERAFEKKTLVFLRFYWFPVLFLPFWLAYRQQWVLWGVLVGLLGFVLPWFEAQVGVDVPAFGVMGSLIAVGMMAEGLLLSTANQRFQALKARGESLEQIERLLTDRAKRSFEMSMAGGLGALVLSIIGSQLIQILWGHPAIR